MFDGQSPAARQARLRMLAMSAMALGQVMQPPDLRGPNSMQYRDQKMISKEERQKRNVRKNIAKKSKRRNRRK